LISEIITPFDFKSIINKILEITINCTIDQDYIIGSNNLSWDNQHQICIGILNRSGAKRKIKRGFFWLKYKIDIMEFWLPHNFNIKALSQQTGIIINLAPTTHSTNLRKNSILASVKISALNLNDLRHISFIIKVINLNKS